VTEGQLRLGIALSVSLLAVAGLLRFWEKDEDEPLDPDATAAIWKVETDAVTKIEVTRADGKLALAKEGEEWRVVEPYEAPADAWTAKDLVNDVTAVESGIPIPEAEAAAFGLADPPEVRVVLTLADGSTKTLDVGMESPVGRKTYVRAADGSVAAVSGDLSTLRKEADDFRDRRLVRFEVGKVTGIRIDSPRGNLDLYEDAQGEWWLRGFTRADVEKVEMLLLGVLDLRFDEILPPAGAPPVDQPEYTVTIALEGGETRRFAVNLTPGIQGRLVAVEGGSTGWVNDETLRILGQGPVDVGDQRAFPFEKDALTKVDLALGDTKWTLERAGDAWNRDGADEPKGEDAVEALQAVAIDYAPPPMPPLSESYGTVTITQGDKTRTIEFGQIHEDKWRLARDRAGGEPYLVPLADLTSVTAVFD
jgi:hypothetical protein